MNISFQPLSEHDYPDFQNDVKDVFSIALIEQFGLPQDKEFFMDDDINETFHNPKLVTYYIYADEKKAGGVALHIDNESHHNRMELFYLNECPHVTKLAKFKLSSCSTTMFWNTLCRI